MARRLGGRGRGDSGQAPPVPLAGIPLSEDEAGYVEAARAPNTLRGYRSDWREFSAWCAGHGTEPLPAAPSTLARYLSELAGAGPRSAP